MEQYRDLRTSVPKPGTKYALVHKIVEGAGCNVICYGKTKRNFKVRICEHLDISHLTGRR